VFGERGAVLELELVRPALLDRQCRHVAVLDRIAKNARAEFLVDQNSGVGCRHALAERLPESLVNHSLAICDEVVFVRSQRWREMEHAGDVGVPMIERQQVQRAVVAKAHMEPCAKSVRALGIPGLPSARVRTRMAGTGSFGVCAWNPAARA
jgi:hypothetical protein